MNEIKRLVSSTNHSALVSLHHGVSTVHIVGLLVKRHSRPIYK